MKFIIASDIHGDSICAEKIIEVFKTQKADKLLLLGDILYHGPRNDLPAGYNPKKVIPLLNSIKEKIVCVRGNCDAEVDQMVLEFPITADFVTLTDGDKTLFLTHGHIFNKENMPDLKQGDIMLCGHTHIKTDEIFNGIRIINPGSVSIPKDGSRSFIIYQDGEFCFKTLE